MELYKEAFRYKLEIETAKDLSEKLFEFLDFEEFEIIKFDQFVTALVLTGFHKVSIDIKLKWVFNLYSCSKISSRGRGYLQKRQYLRLLENVDNLKKELNMCLSSNQKFFERWHQIHKTASKASADPANQWNHAYENDDSVRFQSSSISSDFNSQTLQSKVDQIFDLYDLEKKERDGKVIEAQFLDACKLETSLVEVLDMFMEVNDMGKEF